MIGKGNSFAVDIDDERIKTGELVHINKGKITVKDATGRCFSVSVEDERYLSGELVPASKGSNRNWSTKEVDSLYSSRRGRKWTLEQRERIMASRPPPHNKGIKGVVKQSNEHKEKISKALSGKKKSRKQCFVCGGMFAPHVLSRWHNENCKENS